MTEFDKIYQPTERESNDTYYQNLRSQVAVFGEMGRLLTDLDSTENNIALEKIEELVQAAENIRDNIAHYDHQIYLFCLVSLEAFEWLLKDHQIRIVNKQIDHSDHEHPDMKVMNALIRLLRRLKQIKHRLDYIISSSAKVQGGDGFEYAQDAKTLRKNQAKYLDAKPPTIEGDNLRTKAELPISWLDITKELPKTG
jgi:hypothetical protein